MTTRGIERLKEHGVSHEVLTYHHEVKGVRYAAQMLGLPDEIVIKSLIFQANDGSFIFALMSGDGNVSEKKLARASGHKRVAPASPHDAERVTGYQVGGSAPWERRSRFPSFSIARSRRTPKWSSTPVRVVLWFASRSRI